MTARDPKVQGHGEHIIESIDDVDKAWGEISTVESCSFGTLGCNGLPSSATKKQRKTSMSQLPSADNIVKTQEAVISSISAKCHGSVFRLGLRISFKLKYT